MLVDSHCHPTDHPELKDVVPTLPIQMCIMSTRLDDLDLVDEWAELYPTQLIPAFGIHPWYSHLLTFDSVSKLEHYQSVLHPPPNSETDIAFLPDPVPMTSLLAKLKLLLTKHPKSLLGEVGLDKPFRVKTNGEFTQFQVNMEHQERVLGAQLELASELHRSVSLHGVQCHQALFDKVKTFSGLRAACLHSYGGSGDFYKQFWRKLSFPVYVSIAVLINGRMPPVKLQKLLESLTPELVLSESDMNMASTEQVELVNQSVKLFTEHFGFEAIELEINFKRFANIDRC